MAEPLKAVEELPMLGPQIGVSLLPQVAALPLPLQVGDVAVAEQGVEEIQRGWPRLLQRLLAAVGHVGARADAEMVGRDSMAVFGQTLGVVAHDVLLYPPGRDSPRGDGHVLPGCPLDGLLAARDRHPHW